MMNLRFSVTLVKSINGKPEIKKNRLLAIEQRTDQGVLSGSHASSMVEHCYRITGGQDSIQQQLNQKMMEYASESLNPF